MNYNFVHKSNIENPLYQFVLIDKFMNNFSNEFVREELEAINVHLTNDCFSEAIIREINELKKIVEEDANIVTDFVDVEQFYRIGDIPVLSELTKEDMLYFLKINYDPRYILTIPEHFFRDSEFRQEFREISNLESSKESVDSIFSLMDTILDYFKNYDNSEVDEMEQYIKRLSADYVTICLTNNIKLVA